MDEKYFATWKCYQVIDSKKFTSSASVLCLLEVKLRISTIWTILDVQNWLAHTMFTELVRIGARMLLSESKLMVHVARRHPLRTGIISRVSSPIRGRIEPHQITILEPGEATRREIEILPEDLQLTKAWDDAGPIRNVSGGQIFATVPDVHVVGQGSTSWCREYMYFRSDNRSQPKEYIRSDNKNMSGIWQSRLPKPCDRHGMERKIDSMQKDGTQSWMVLNRGVDKYVTNLLRRTRSLFTMKKRLQAQGNLLRWNKWNNLHRCHLRHQPYRSNNESGRIYPQFRRLLTLIATKIENMTKISRHYDCLGEVDGAIEWRKLFSLFYRENPELKKSTKQAWLNYLEKGSIRKRLQYCLGSNCIILHMRAIQGRQILYNWSE